MPEGLRPSWEGTGGRNKLANPSPGTGFARYRGTAGPTLRPSKRAQGEITVALTHEPTAPYHSAQDALRVLEIVARRSCGVTDAELARRTGLRPERLTALLRMLRREGYVEQITGGAYVTGDTLQPSSPPRTTGSAPCARSSSTPWTGCVTRSARRST